MIETKTQRDRIFLDTLFNKAVELQRIHGDLRFGQALYNAAHMLLPVLVNTYISYEKGNDPYYLNERIPAFIQTLLENR